MRFKDILKMNPFAAAAILFALLVSGLTFIYSKTLAVIELASLTVLVVFAVWWMSNTLERKKNALHLLEQSIAQNGEAGQRTASFPLPSLLVNSNGDIVWFNELFDSVLESFEDVSGTTVFDIVPGAEAFLSGKNLSSFEIAGKKKKFTVYPSELDEGLFALYFIEDTALKDIRTRFNLTRPAVLFINVDSLEQTEDSLAHADYYSVISDVERIISKWLVSHNCVFRKFTDGKFIVFTECSNLDNMVSHNFDILDKVRAYRSGHDEVDITLSVGIGKEESFTDCEYSARQALDMARGRGGDQVALKIGDSYEFFGGITSRKEKRGKIKSRIVAAALGEYIENCSSVYVMGHGFSDFDSLGASVGVAAIAAACGKPAYVVVNRRTTLALPLVEMLEKAGERINFISPDSAYENITEDSLVVVADTMRPKITEAPGLLERKLKTVIIDHHRMTVDHIDGAALLFHEPYASSACEMVTELIQYSPSKPKLTPAQAQALLAGIILDTKNFSLRVGVRTFEAAAFLRDRKTDTVAVRKLFSGSVEENINVSRIITAAKFYKNYCISVVDFDVPSLRLVASKAADELLDIENVDASFVISHNGGEVYISARSLGRINVQLIMERLGGGGHQSMAACQLKDTTVQDALQQLKESIKIYFEKNS